MSTIDKTDWVNPDSKCQTCKHWNQHGSNDYGECKRLTPMERINNTPITHKNCGCFRWEVIV